MDIARVLAATAMGFAGGVGGIAATAIGAGVVCEAFDLDTHSTVVFLSLGLGIPFGSVAGLRVASAVLPRLGSPPPRIRLLADGLALIIAVAGILMLLLSNRAGETVAAALVLTALATGVIYASGEQGRGS